MTRAEAEPVEPDGVRARQFLTQARLFFADADRETTALESAVVLFWSACLSAMDAVLAQGVGASAAATSPTSFELKLPLPRSARDTQSCSSGWTNGAARGMRFRTPPLRPPPRWSMRCERTPVTSSLRRRR